MSFLQLSISELLDIPAPAETLEPFINKRPAIVEKQEDQLKHDDVDDY